MEKHTSTSLSRFRISDEHLITDQAVKESINLAYSEGRCFEFYPDNYIIERIREGDPAEIFREQFFDMANSILDSYTDAGGNYREKLTSDTRLFSRIVNALALFHHSAAGTGMPAIGTRRIVLVQELPGRPTLHHISRSTTVVAHVGQGPEWAEVPSIYLGLKTFDTLHQGRLKKDHKLFEAFSFLLSVEERAIETGYSHSTMYPAESSALLNLLVDSIIDFAEKADLDYKKEIPAAAIEKFSPRKRQELIAGLNARIPDNELNFDYDLNIAAMNELKKYARTFKKSEDRDSLHEIVKILVAASGHDLHDIRNRANILLERIFSPKEFDAPVATRFINLKSGDTYDFTFRLDEGPEKNYTLRIYRNSSAEQFNTEQNIEFTDLPMETRKPGEYTCSYRFEEYGHYDFTVIDKNGAAWEWVRETGCSGRVNVIPDIRGEIILEIFVDIHGHTRLYWRDHDGHPGLVYNENGQVIRLGKFEDITCHLEDLKARYYISSIYLLGVQQRGTNREDWAPEATSPSPFSPVSLTLIEPSLGGEEQFRKLIEKAHSLDIKVIVDIIPHLNRKSTQLPDSYSVLTYDSSGHLVERASTDGRYGSWNDGRLLNYRMFEIWEWLSGSITELIEKYGIDGIRFDSAHALPIMMKRNNYPFVYSRERTDQEMLAGNIIVNDREYGHFMTTGFYDCECRDSISVPIHYYLMLQVEKKLKELKKDFFINIAECFWGHERFLTRTGLIPYNSALFKICENITHGKSDVREIYHLYDSYFPSVLPEGTELLGILGNHDERRALNTFGHRGLRAAVAITSFLSNIILDYEGSAEGEGWKVFLDNIYVNWNEFEYASNRSVSSLYSDLYRFHRDEKGDSSLIWANNNMVAAALKYSGDCIWVGAFNFSDSNQNASLQFDSPSLKLDDDDAYMLSDPLYSDITESFSWYTGKELRASRINTVVSYTERVKILKLQKVSSRKHYSSFLTDSFRRLCELENTSSIGCSFAFNEIAEKCTTYRSFTSFIRKNLVENESLDNSMVALGLKRSIFFLHKYGKLKLDKVHEYIRKMGAEGNFFQDLSESLVNQYRRGALVFMSAEAEPFSKSGGLANVVYELPRELARLGEQACIITPLYRNGNYKEKRKMEESLEKYGVSYTGKTVHIKIMDQDYEVGVHHAEIEGIDYYLLDHHEFFNGLYWGVTSEEKLRKRIGFARACAEVILTFGINVKYTFTNDAFAGIFNGIVRSDPYYDSNPLFRECTFIHIVHNGGWQYFDAYDRYEKGFDLFNLFNLPSWRFGDFSDPVFGDRINCMASGIRMARKTVTVSPSYARQIEIACDGLEHILKNVSGISNAIGSDFREKIEERMEASGFIRNMFMQLVNHIEGHKELRHKIENRYPELLMGEGYIESMPEGRRRDILWRMRNKLMLQLERGLRVDPDLILTTMIHRISEQKGFQLLLESSEGIVKNLGMQIIIGGGISSGDNRGEAIAHGLYLLGQYYPDMVNVSFGFQDVSVPLLSSDFFLMPSMHEPGGISQLEAMAAGCPVIARATGGLRDTIKPVISSGGSIEGSGFLFSDFTSWSFYDAMDRAASFFRESDDETIAAVRERAEQSSYFWDRPAMEYIREIYSLTETILI